MKVEQWKRFEWKWSNSKRGRRVVQSCLRSIRYVLDRFPRDVHGTFQCKESERLFTAYISATLYPTNRNVRAFEGVHGKPHVIERA